MLSTVFNSVVLKNVLEEVGIKSVVIDPIGIKFLEKYNKDIAIKYLNK
jgi:uridylate kinase